MTDSAPLFRNEVVTALRESKIGIAQIRPPKMGWVILAFALSILAATLTLLLVGHYTWHERVDGRIVSSGGLLIMSAVSPGTLVRVMVHEGQHVNKGQPLLEISREQDSAVIGATQGNISKLLQSKRERLQSDLLLQERLKLLQEDDLGMQISILQSQLEQLDEQIAIQNARTDGADAIYKQWSKLGSTGIVSKIQISQQKDAALGSLAQQKQLRVQSFELKQHIQQLEAQLHQLPALNLIKRNETERQITEVNQLLAENAAQRSMLLTATSDGTITNVLAGVGQSIFPQQPLVTVIPAHSTMQAELLVPSKSVGLIRTGDTVILRYQAFPYQSFGIQTGHVKQVSQSAISAAETSQYVGQLVNEPKYRVVVTLDAQSITALGHVYPLKLGMTLSADIILRKQRLLNWRVAP